MTDELERRRRAVDVVTRRRIRRFDQSFADSCVGANVGRALWFDENDVDGPIYAHGPLRFPKWPWARFDNQEFRHRVDSRLLPVAEAHDERAGSLVLCGKTGAGKSSLIVARLWRQHDAVRTKVEAGEQHRIDFAWVSGFELAGARKRSGLGDEAPLVKHAIDVGLLILDDVGCEPLGEETFVVLDARYREQRPVILTSPLEPAALIRHLGGGGYRRLLEHGRLVEAFGEAPKAKATVRVVR